MLKLRTLTLALGLSPLLGYALGIPQNVVPAESIKKLVGDDPYEITRMVRTGLSQCALVETEAGKMIVFVGPVKYPAPMPLPLHGANPTIVLDRFNAQHKDYVEEMFESGSCSGRWG